MGNKVLSPDNNREDSRQKSTKTAKPRNVLNAADTNEFGVPGGVTENTTELLGAIQRHNAPNRSN